MIKRFKLGKQRAETSTAAPKPVPVVEPQAEAPAQAGLSALDMLMEGPVAEDAPEAVVSPQLDMEPVRTVETPGAVIAPKPAPEAVAVEPPAPLAEPVADVPVAGTAALRVCIIGNSHMGALKLGLEQIAAAYPDIAVTFFGHRADRLRGLVLRDGRLEASNQDLRAAITHTSGGLDHIDPAAYDIFLVHALDIKGFFPDAARPYSRQVLAATLRDIAQYPNFLVRIVRDLRTLTDKPVYIGLAPLYAASATAQADESGAARYLDTVALMNEVLFAGINVIAQSQPAETVLNAAHTSIAYSVGSRRLGVGDNVEQLEHPETDVAHMNAAFGALWLRDFFARLVTT